MANTIQKSNTQSGGAFAAVADSILGARRNIGKVWMSQGAANARIKKVAVLNAKSDDELAMMGLRRENIISAVFFGNVEI